AWGGPVTKHGIAPPSRARFRAAARAHSPPANAAALPGERARLLEKTLRDYRRNGFDLAPELRQRVKELNERLVELGIVFSRNIDTWDDAILVTREELVGLPPSFIEGLQTVEVGGRGGEPPAEEIGFANAAGLGGPGGAAPVEGGWGSGNSPKSKKLEYRVSLDYPDFFPFMDNAESEELRRELQIKFFRQGGEQN